MAYPKNPRYISQNITLANYNYTDIAEGSGIIIYRGATMHVSGSTTYNLTTQSIYSKDIETKTVLIEVTNHLFNTCDFDLTQFNMPRTIGGTALVQIPVAGIGANALSAAQGHLVVYIQKWDGSTATTIGSAATEPTDILASGSVVNHHFDILPINISDISFKPGEILRCKVELWGEGVIAQGGYVAIGHDPQNRAGTMFLSGSIMNVHIPFKIDV